MPGKRSANTRIAPGKVGKAKIGYCEKSFLGEEDHADGRGHREDAGGGAGGGGQGDGALPLAAAGAGRGAGGGAGGGHTHTGTPGLRHQGGRQVGEMGHHI